MRRSWKAILGVGLSAFLIWYTLRDVDPVAVWHQVQRANLWLLAGAVAIATFGFAVRAWRWRILLHPLRQDTTFHDRFSAVNIGFMANNLVGGRVGEFARAYAYSRLDPRVSVSGAFGTLVVERLLDALTLSAFLVLTVLAPSFPDVALGPRFTALIRLAALLLGALVVMIGFLLALPGPVVRLVERLAGFLPASAGRIVVDALEAFMEALGVVRSPALLAQAVAWTVGFWLFHGVSFWLGMLAFGIHSGPIAAWFTEAVVGFGVALPAAPGFFGTFHASAQFALETVYQADPVRTLAFAYGYHIGGFIPVTLMGLWYARALGLSLGDVRASEARVEEAVEGTHHDSEPGSGPS